MPRNERVGDAIAGGVGCACPTARGGHRVGPGAVAAIAAAVRRLLALLVGILCLVGVEGLVRLLDGPPPAPTRVYAVNAPDTRFLRVEGDELHAAFQNNSPNPVIPRVPPRRRVAVIGGSSVHIGSGVDDPEFPQLLRKKIDADVMNLGAPGLDSADHVRQVEELLDDEWTAIVMYAGHNDFGNAFFLQRYAGRGGVANAMTRQLLERSATYVLLREALMPAGGRTNMSPRPDMPAMTDEQVAMAEADLATNYARMAWLCERAGTKLVVAVPAVSWTEAPVQTSCERSPCAYQLHQQASLRLASQGARAPTAEAKKLGAMFRAAGDADRQLLHVTLAAQQMMRDLALREGLVLVDADRDLPRAAGADVPDPELFLDHVHFNARGHREMAALLAGPLAELLGG